MTAGTIVCDVTDPVEGPSAAAFASVLGTRLALRVVFTLVRATWEGDSQRPLAAIAEELTAGAEIRLTVGDHAEALARMAAEEGADLIIVGSRAVGFGGHGGGEAGDPRGARGRSSHRTGASPGDARASRARQRADGAFTPVRLADRDSGRTPARKRSAAPLGGGGARRLSRGAGEPPNVAWHAEASRVDLSLEPGAGSVVLRVVDDGTGLSESSALNGHGGLRGMRERALLVGAALAVKTAPSGGVEVRLEVPAGDS